MRLKIGYLLLICLAFGQLAQAQDANLEEKMRQLSVDVPKQQAELQSQIRELQEELARTKQQFLIVQEQLVELEATQQELIQKNRELEELNKKVDILQREVNRPSSSPGSPAQDNTKLQKLEDEFYAFKKSLRKSGLILIPLLLGISIYI